ncbi:integration host factor subunit alpha [Geomonas sp. Red69]|nr:integration host factor subunit alpha [Geomonas diazotrophica]
MTKNDLVEAIKNGTSMTKAEAVDTLETLLEVMKDTLVSGEELKVSGFGKWGVKAKNERVGRNPQTGEMITIEGRKVLSFKPSPTLKLRVNTGNS